MFRKLFVLLIVFAMGCGSTPGQVVTATDTPKPTLTQTKKPAIASTQTQTSTPALTLTNKPAVTSTQTQTSTALAPQIPQGKTIIVTSAEDSGAGTLRQALLDAQAGDTITFDSVVFKPETPATIRLLSGLPVITQGYLTLDASNAGVILDGSQAGGEWTSGIEIASEHNIIRGIQALYFTGPGIQLHPSAKFNTVGGNRQIGAGPLGQGNLFSDNADGVAIFGSTENTILGNLIGTDVSGTSPLANRTAGIFLEDSAKRNTVGPNNVIAYNGGHGVDIRFEEPFGNTITQNSIHDNVHFGITLREFGNIKLTQPLIYDFNLNDGTVAGSTCANCTVEIFSDNEDEGQRYDGSTTADGSGNFTFNKGSSLSGPHLTATATDNSGNTSKFSFPTSGTSRSLNLQTENGQTRFQFKTKQSNELEDNRIGGSWNAFSSLDMEKVVENEILLLGLKRVRLAINGISFDAINWDVPELIIDPKDDLVFTRLADNGVAITYVLTFWDKVTYPGGVGVSCPRFKTEAEIQRYLDFVRIIVHHFKDRVQYYEIWNEPDMGWGENNMEPCIEAIDVDDYVNLIRRAVLVIHDEYPEAKIVVGSTMTWAEPVSQDYMLTVLNSDIMPLVDVVAWHPSGPSPEYEYWRERYYSYLHHVQVIKDVASAHGFKGEYSADEMVWWTEEDVPPWEPWTYSRWKAAKYYARFIILHLGEDVTVQAGGVSDQRVVSFRTIQNLCTIMAGAEPVSLPVEIESQAMDIMSYAFSLPNGDQLFALWTHGAASDDNPSISATLTFPGITEHSVTGIDVLHGFQQQLITSEEKGGLVIRNMLVKDYPIILRVASIRYHFLHIGRRAR